MKKGLIKDHIYNPYRYLENTGNQEAWDSFIKSQGFPSSWGFRELKLAWAFQGLLGKPISHFNLDCDYITYVYEPYLTDFRGSLKDALVNVKKEPFRFRYAPNVSGHWCVTLLDSKYCTLSKHEKNLLLKHGIYNSDNSKLIIDLKKALQIAGESRSTNFRIITRLNKKSDIFSALCHLFEIPDSETDHYPRDTFRCVFSDNAKLCQPARKWLNSWVEDEPLKTHLSCFMEQRQGLRGRQDIYLTSHYLEKWNIHLENKDNFPFGLEPLRYLKNTSCLLGWEWEHIDLRESMALVQIPKR